MINSNENRPGYKKTKAGWIPKEWECVPLGRLGEWKGGGTPSKVNDSYWENGTIPWATSQDIKQTIISNTYYKITESGLKNSSSSIIPPDGIIMVTRSGILRHSFPVAIAQCPVAINQDIKALITGDDVCALYVLNQLQFNKSNVLKSCSKVGTTVESIQYDSLKKFPIPFPPLPEQERIAEVLSAWDKAIELTDKLIDAKQRLKNGLMQQLLTGRMRFSGMEGKWHETILSQMGETYSGLNGKSKDDFGYGKPFVPYLNIFANESVNMSDLGYVKIGPKEKQTRVMYGDILFTGSSETPNEVGISSVVTQEPDELYLNSFCIGFRPRDLSRLLPIFAQYYMRGPSFRKQMAIAAQGATRFNLSRKTLLKSKVVFPNAKEQRLIANCLYACSREIQLLIIKRDNLQKQKNGLMQKLLIGEIRTVYS